MKIRIPVGDILVWIGIAAILALGAFCFRDMIGPTPEKIPHVQKTPYCCDYNQKQ